MSRQRSASASSRARSASWSARSSRRPGRCACSRARASPSRRNCACARSRSRKAASAACAGSSGRRADAARDMGSPFEVVALAASAGGLNALTHVLAALPREFPAALVVVQHLHRGHRSPIAQILARRTRIAVNEAHEGEALRAGSAYIAPSNRHLLINPDRTLSLTQTELVHFVRPSADLLFESTAASFRERAIAVVLSGSGEDGAMGVKAIKKMGGTVIVQDAHAEFSGMPGAALATGVA